VSTFVNSNENSANSSAVSVGYVSVAAGRLAVVCVTISGLTVQTPSGWTRLDVNNTISSVYYIYAKILTGSESGSWTANIIGTGNWMAELLIFAPAGGSTFPNLGATVSSLVFSQATTSKTVSSGNAGTIVAGEVAHSWASSLVSNQINVHITGTSWSITAAYGASFGGVLTGATRSAAGAIGAASVVHTLGSVNMAELGCYTWRVVDTPGAGGNGLFFGTNA
jgi:hypothetical protein